MCLLNCDTLLTNGRASSDHWIDVKPSIVFAGFNPNLVSDAEDIVVIQKIIERNIYMDDVSLLVTACQKF